MARDDDEARQLLTVDFARQIADDSQYTTTPARMAAWLSAGMPVKNLQGSFSATSYQAPDARPALEIIASYTPETETVSVW